MLSETVKMSLEASDVQTDEDCEDLVSSPTLSLVLLFHLFYGVILSFVFVFLSNLCPDVG